MFLNQQETDIWRLTSIVVGFWRPNLDRRKGRRRVYRSVRRLFRPVATARNRDDELPARLGKCNIRNPVLFLEFAHRCRPYALVKFLAIVPRYERSGDLQGLLFGSGISFPSPAAWAGTYRSLIASA
jgi:hypothetical protein